MGEKRDLSTSSHYSHLAGCSALIPTSRKVPVVIGARPPTMDLRNGSETLVPLQWESKPEAFRSCQDCRAGVD